MKTRKLRILIIEDNKRTGEHLLERFRKLGHDCSLITNGDRGYFEALRGVYDIVIVDLTLKGSHAQGEHIIAGMIRERTPSQILVLTGEPDPAIHFQMLAQGAGDCVVKILDENNCITKPFAFEVIHERVMRLVESPRIHPDLIRYKHLVYDIANRTIRDGEKVAYLTEAEGRLFKELMTYRHVLKAEHLDRIVRDLNYSKDDAWVRTLVKTIRAKCAKAKIDDPIHTDKGNGYGIIF